jgi:hypothetical protein
MTIINESVNSVEPYVFGFANEANCLLDLSVQMTSRDRRGLTARIDIGKEHVLSIAAEVQDKSIFLNRMRKHSQRGGVATYLMTNRARFLESRVYEMS